jgi:predicted nuclease with TOPRIM domain
MSEGPIQVVRTILKDEIVHFKEEQLRVAEYIKDTEDQLRSWTNRLEELDKKIAALEDFLVGTILEEANHKKDKGYPSAGGRMI